MTNSIQIPTTTIDSGSAGLHDQATLQWVDESLTSNTLFFDLVEDERWDGGAEVTGYPVETGPSVTDNVRPEPDTVTLRIFVTNEPLKGNYWQQPVTSPSQIGPGMPSWLPGSGIVRYNVWKNNLESRSLLAGAGGTIGGIAGSLAGPTGAAVGGAAGFAAGTVAGQLLLAGAAVPEVANVGPGLASPGGQTLVTTVQTPQFLVSQDFVELLIGKLDELKDAATMFTVAGSKKTIGPMVIEKVGHHRGPDTGSGAEITITLKQIRMVETQSVAAPAPTLPRAQATVSTGAQSTTDATPRQSLLWGQVNE